ncbi:MAG: hypothetical protein F6K42_22405 [Leptolyngbya sp. SIO1D8]|nr:hypothetical protein [Leptolyngbya sp. SIO1D8]
MSNLDNIGERNYQFKTGQYFGRGWEIFNAYALPFVGFTILLVVIFAAVSFILPFPLGSGSEGGGNIVMNILSPILGAGYYIVAFQIARNRPKAFGDFFKGFNRFLPILLLSIVSSILILVGIILLIIPGLYLAVAYMFAMPLLLDKNLDFWASLETSRKLITKKWLSFFIFVILLIFLNLAGAILLGIGLLVTLPLTNCVIVAAYEDIVGLNSVADSAV